MLEMVGEAARHGKTPDSQSRATLARPGPGVFARTLSESLKLADIAQTVGCAPGPPGAVLPQVLSLYGGRLCS